MLIIFTAQIAATRPVCPGPAAKLTLPHGSHTPTAIVNDMQLTNFGSFASADEVLEENQEDPDRAKINLDAAAAEAVIANHPEISNIPHVLGGVGIEEVLDEHQRYAGLQFDVYVDDPRNVKAVRRAVPEYLEGFPVVVRTVPIIKDW